MASQLTATEELIQRFATLPGVGQKTAEKFAFHVLDQSKEDALALACAIERAKSSMRTCSRCFNVTDADPCGICADARRDETLLCVVETARDVIAMERTGAFRGLYHVLGGHVAPLDDVGPDALTIRALLDRLSREGVREIILATNPTLDGDATALCVAKALDAGPDVRVSRIATGVPSGASIEHVGRATLAEAIEHRNVVGTERADEGDSE